MINLDLVLPLLAALSLVILAVTLRPSAYGRLLGFDPLASEKRHRLDSARTPYRPRSWDQVTADFERLATPAEAAELTFAADFDPLDHDIPLAEVEMWTASWGDPLPSVRDLAPISAPPLAVAFVMLPLMEPPATDWTATETWSEAVREGWERATVTAAGKSWDTHMAKFSGAVLPREDSDTGELVAIA